jgi:hypothetical protein
MTGPNFMQGWMRLFGLLATMAIILTAFGLMMGIVKPASAMKRLGAIIGIVIALMFIPGILVNAWSSMSLWQQIGLVAIAIAVWRCLRPRRRTRNAKHD